MRLLLFAFLFPLVPCHELSEDGCFHKWTDFKLECALPFERRSQIALADCQTICNEMPPCRTVNYHPRAQLCDLYGIPIEEGPPMVAKGYFSTGNPSYPNGVPSPYNTGGPPSPQPPYASVAQNNQQASTYEATEQGQSRQGYENRRSARRNGDLAEYGSVLLNSPYARRRQRVRLARRFKRQYNGNGGGQTTMMPMIVIGGSSYPCTNGPLVRPLYGFELYAATGACAASTTPAGNGNGYGSRRRFFYL